MMPGLDWVEDRTVNGVKVSKQLENNCPKFLNMLERISQNIAPTGRSKETERRLEVARERTEEARRSYLQTLVRYETLTDLITSRV